MSDIENKSESPKRWRRSIDTPNGSRSVCVKEIENGFIIEMNKSWTDKEGNYKFEEKTMYSPENPLEEKDLEIDSKMINDFINPPINLM